jgi:hypothetical protein
VTTAPASPNLLGSNRICAYALKGGWPFLNKALFGYPVELITRDSLELGILLRWLDEDQNLSDYMKSIPEWFLGRVVKQGAADEPLYVRDLTNKLSHSSHFSWDRSNEMDPKLICHSPDPKRWVRAEISMIGLAYLCGQIMS